MESRIQEQLQTSADTSHVRIVTSSTPDLDVMIEWLSPFISSPDVFFGRIEPFSIKVGNIIYQDRNDGNGGDFYLLDEVVILSGDMKAEDFAKWTLIELQNPEELFEQNPGVLRFKGEWVDDIEVNMQEVDWDWN